MKTVRVIRLHIQPEIVVDDGAHLSSLAVQAITVNACDWEAFTVDGLARALAQLQQQVTAEGQTKGI